MLRGAGEGRRAQHCSGGVRRPSSLGHFSFALYLGWGWGTVELGGCLMGSSLLLLWEVEGMGGWEGKDPLSCLLENSGQVPTLVNTSPPFSPPLPSTLMEDTAKI